MTSRQRVEAALNHKLPDKVPIDLGSTAVTGMSVSTVSKLRIALGLDKPGTPVKIIEPYQMLGDIADDLKNNLGVDCIGLWGRKNMFGFENQNWKPWKLFDGTPVLVPGLFNTEPDKNGNILQYPQGDKAVPPSGKMPDGGYYFDTIIRQPPIDDEHLNVDDNLEEFGSVSDEELDYYRKQAEYLYGNTDFAIVANFGGTAFGDIALVPAPFLKYPKGIRDIEEWYVSTAIRKGYVYEVFERQCNTALANLAKIYQAVGNKVTAVFISGTDFGTQNVPFISNDTYKELYKPFHVKVNSWVHKNTKWKTFIHSCGAVEPLLCEFIDAEFDILNPVQCSAVGMDPDVLKSKYGDKIAFWGGGIDTQQTLPFGTPDQVRKQVRERIEIFKNNGGFVFNPIHNIQANTPIENLLAMYEAFQRYRTC